MSTYKGIRGLKVRDYTTNPDNPIEGQLWYNKTDQVGKYQVPVVTTTGAWRTANSINTARDDGYMVGIQTSALYFGGKTNPPPVRKSETESYDGLTFTEVNDLNTARGGPMGGGTDSTSAIAAGGQTGAGDGTAVANVETWNGSSWTETTDINSARFLGASGGTSTSTLIFGGYPAGGGAPGYTDKTESWNGSAWTNITDSNNPQPSKGGAGADNENALFFGGAPYGNTAVNEHWDGSSWTELGDINTARSNHAGVGKTYTAAIAATGLKSGGSEAPECESWNGTSWTEVGDVNTARGYVSGDGTSTSGLIYGGTSATPARVANAESWNGTAWTETGDLSTARTEGPLGGAGSGNTNALMFGGNTGSDSNATEEFTSPTETSETITTS